MSHYQDYDYLLVNDDFATATEELSAIVRAERLRLFRQQRRLGSLLDDLLKAP
jgi:guanylate kinase